MLVVTAASMTTTEVASPTSSDVEGETEDAEVDADLVSEKETERVGASEDEEEDDAGDDAGEDAEDDAEDDADLVRNPGVRLGGRRVRKLFAVREEDPSQPQGYKRFFKQFTGSVLGARPDATWGTVYGVRYEDGEEQEVIYEELLPIFDEPNEKQRAVPLAAIEASKKARSKWSLEKYFPRDGFRPGALRKCWVGVKRDPEASEDAFYGVATDPRTNVEHHFDVIFTTRHAAGAAHDLLVRRMRAVAAKPRNFIGWDEADDAPAARARGRNGEKKVNVDFEELNFPDASWNDLCGIVLGTVATKLTANAVSLKPDSSKRPTPAAPPPAPRAEKKKKRDPKAPHRKNVGGRVYDSRLGVSCHWCRQKTHEAHVTCTSPTCALPGSRLAVSFCGQCLKNRNGEDVFAARESGRWVCPRCRGSCGPGCASCCNCGPCRIAKGFKPTGPGIAHAFAAGFGNVHDFLVGGVTGESREAVARRKLDFEWGAWLAPRNEASPSATPPPATPAGTPPASPAMLPMTPTTPATPDTPTMPLAVVPPRGLVVPAAASASAAVADLRRALGDAKAMVAEGLLDDQDFGKVKASVLAGIAFGAGGGASKTGA